MKNFLDYMKRNLERLDFEFSFPVVGWLLSFFAVMTQPHSPFLFLALLICLLLIFLMVIKSPDSPYYPASLLSKVLFALTFVVSLFTGSLKSPLLPLLLGAFIYNFTRESRLSTLTALTFIFITIPGSTYILEQNFFLRFSTPLLVYSSLLITALAYFHLINVRKFQSATPDYSALDSDFSLEDLWVIFDIERAMLKASNEKELLNAYLENIPFCPPICRLILISRVERKAILYRLNPENREISSSDCQTGFNFEKSVPQASITDQNGKKYRLSVYNDFFALYHEAKQEIKQFEHLLKLIDEILLENLTRIKLAQYKNILFDNLISLQMLVKEAQRTESLYDFFEVILLTLKKIALFEKAFYVPCKPDKPNSPAFERKIIKGPYIRLPEEEWGKVFRQAVKDAISQKKVVTLKKEKITIIAVPILQNGSSSGVIGGITTNKTNLPLLIHLIEFIALFLSLISKQRLAEQSRISELEQPVNADHVVSLYQLLFAAEDLELMVNKYDAYPNILTLKKFARNLRKHLKEAIVKSMKKDFAGALKDYLQSLQKVLNEVDISLQYSLSIDAEPDLKHLDAIATVFIESILNSLFHAKASSIEIIAESKKDGFMIGIKDNGRGFDLKKALEKIKSDPESYSGLRTMAYETRRCGCKLKIRSEVSKGTAIELTYLSPAGK